MSFEDKLISAVTQYDELQSRKKSWNPRALGIYITRANEIASDVRRGAGQREAIIAGFTGSILSYVLRKMKLSPPTRDEFTGAGRMTYRAVRQNPPFEWTLRQANSITPSGFSATMRGNLSSELMVSSWGGKRIIRGVVFKYKVDPDHYYFLYKEPLIRSSDPYRVAEATTGLTLGTPGKMKTVIRDAEERIRKFIAEHGKAKYDSLISSAEKLNHVEGGMVLKNPPFYAHNLYEKKTHGLNLKQMRRLYAMVSRGNQKAITYARNVLGIPFSESPSQVKAVVLHHVRDLAERGVRRNPGGDSISPTRYEKIWNRNFEVNNLILLKEFWPGAKYDPMGAEMLARRPWKLLPADVKRSLRRGFASL